MAQNIKEILKNDLKTVPNKLSEGHKKRFENRLDTAFYQKKKSASYLRIVASVALLLSLSFIGVRYYKTTYSQVAIDTKDVVRKPEINKIEEFYLTQITFQISKIKFTDENKDLIAIYLSQLSKLQKEYKELKLNTDEFNEEVLDKIIENLQLRLQLLQDLKNKLKLIEKLKLEQNENNNA